MTVELTQPRAPIKTRATVSTSQGLSIASCPAKINTSRATRERRGEPRNGERNAATLRKVPRRLARCRRCPSPQSLHHPKSSNRIRAANAHRKPKPKAITPAVTVAQAAGEFTKAQAHNPNTRAALHALIAEYGKLHPSDLTADELQRIVTGWRSKYAQHTRSTYSKILRRFVHWLERVAGAQPTLSDAVTKVRQPAARLTIATDYERETLLRGASPALHFFILLCADLGLRHRTASKITRANYNPHLRALTFVTKGNVTQTLPVTPAIADAIEALPPHSDPLAPIVNILRASNHPGQKPGPNPRFTKQWTKLKAKLGIRPELRVHDLRRTLAEDVWDATHDLRAVQAQLGHGTPTTTARYLANRIHMRDLEPVLQRVQHLRATRELHTATACQSCPGPPHCTTENRLCQRKTYDA